MGIPDRIILTLYTILMAVFAVFLILFTLQIISPTTVYAFCSTVPGRWEYAVGGVVLLLVSLRLLVTGLGGTGISTLALGEEKDGKISVSKSAVEDFVAELSNDIYGVHNAKAAAKMVESALNIRISASIEPGINIPDTTDEMKQAIRKSVFSTLGVEIKDIEVFFKHIQAKK
ncbi:MAG: alkaline shock response membrane anchor protein AmaP [Acholeplasmataceae bacterium]|nr:alkaline shock response membrane anchor protein AmaP [Acholeplasmataceae bacterium]